MNTMIYLPSIKLTDSVNLLSRPRDTQYISEASGDTDNILAVLRTGLIDKHIRTCQDIREAVREYAKATTATPGL